MTLSPKDKRAEFEEWLKKTLEFSEPKEMKARAAFEGIVSELCAQKHRDAALKRLVSFMSGQCGDVDQIFGDLSDLIESILTGMGASPCIDDDPLTPATTSASTQLLARSMQRLPQELWSQRRADAEAAVAAAEAAEAAKKKNVRDPRTQT